MRTLKISVFGALLASNACAQTPRPSSTPLSTDTSCASISAAVARSSAPSILVPAETAYNCLLSVPFATNAAALTISELRKMLQFHSGLAYLKNPPKGYANPPVDILGGLDDIARKIEAGEYRNEYTFEAEVAQLLAKGYDGHLNFLGMTYYGALRFRRDRSIGLVSASRDGGMPKIYTLGDIDQNSYEPSPVTQINDEEVRSFLQKEADVDSHHDPDARWNTLFYQAPKEAFGIFNTPRRYPGRSTKVTFANGTSITVPNAALVAQPDAWESITDGASFYKVIVVGSDSSQEQRSIDQIARDYVPPEYITPEDMKISKRELPSRYPQPFVQHSAKDSPIAGFFLDTPKVSGLAVLTISTFQTESVAGSREFQTVLQRFLAECRTRQAKRIIVDVRTNPGGKLFLGYEAFKQFFPTTEPFGGSRFRAHAASDLYGSVISSLPWTLSTSQLYSTPFNHRSWLDENLKPFSSWSGLIGRSQFNGDNFTAVLRYNLSDPSNTVPTDTGLGISLTGYGPRTNVKDVSFDKDSIVILSDGICASTCSLFVEFMQQQAGVRTFAVGGRPDNGPMQPVGGTKGARVLTYEFFQSVSLALIRNFAGTQAQARRWQATLPIGFGINVAASGVNFQDNIRENQRDLGIPTQFVNDTAHCRLFYGANMYTNTSALWSAVADAMWGGSNGGMDSARCVKGSSASEQIAVNPSAPVGGRPGPSATSKAAAAGGVVIPSWSWTPVIITTLLLSSGLFGAGSVLL